MLKEIFYACLICLILDICLLCEISCNVIRHFFTVTVGWLHYLKLVYAPCL